jgi:hypothetical protein
MTAQFEIGAKDVEGYDAIVGQAAWLGLRLRHWPLLFLVHAERLALISVKSPRHSTWRPELEPARVAEFPQPAHKARAPNTEQFTACTLRIAPNDSEPLLKTSRLVKLGDFRRVCVGNRKILLQMKFCVGAAAPLGYRLRGKPRSGAG